MQELITPGVVSLDGLHDYPLSVNFMDDEQSLAMVSHTKSQYYIIRIEEEEGVLTKSKMLP